MKKTVENDTKLIVGINNDKNKTKKKRRSKLSVGQKANINRKLSTVLKELLIYQTNSFATNK